MNYKRRRKRIKHKWIVDHVWGWKKSSKLDYRRKKEFKRKKKLTFLRGFETPKRKVLWKTFMG